MCHFCAEGLKRDNMLILLFCFHRENVQFDDGMVFYRFFFKHLTKTWAMIWKNS